MIDCALEYANFISYTVGGFYNDPEGQLILLGEPKKRNAQKFLCSQNVKYLSTKCFKTTLSVEIQLVNHSI